LLERGETTPIALPPWALDGERGDCTTLALLAPSSTHFLAHLHPWPDRPSAYASSAGALQLTRCGRERATLVRVLIEMRSPRAVVHTLVAVGDEAPPPLVETLPARDAGRAAPPGEVGPAPARASLAERLDRFEARAKTSGAAAVARQPVPRLGYARLSLDPGCHQLLITAPDSAARFRLLLAEKTDERPERLESLDLPDIRHELCTVRPRALLLALEAPGDDEERTLSHARFPLPSDVPSRFGPELAEKLVRALGGANAPRRLGSVVHATLGAQGRTPLPRELLPHTCYLAAAVVAHGQPQQLSLGVRAGGTSREATSADGAVGPRVAFCTGHRSQVDIDVEARGLGLAWLFVLLQSGPERPLPP
jgi:hypothetical protein